MKAVDIAAFAWRSLAAYRTRTLLIVLAMSIGVSAVVVLTSLGHGAREYVRNQLAALGANLIVVIPGRADTFGGSGGVLSGRTPRDLTIDDAVALLRIPGVANVTPVNIVAGEVSARGRRRDAPIGGATHAVQDFWGLEVAQGRFLPEQDPRLASAVCVIGYSVRRELFGVEPAVGQLVRVGDRRFRVIGTLQQKGQFLGINMDDIVIMPVASAQAVFNLKSLLRVAASVSSPDEVPQVKEQMRRVLRERHEGEEDVTLVTEDSVATAFDRILGALTLALGGIASISLGVAGILIMNVMLIAVAQRTSEIGLLKAVGATPNQIRTVFFAEAAMLASAGAVAGSLLGQIGSWVVRQLYPVLPAYPPLWASLAAFALALAAGIVFTILPARRAAQLDPVLALGRR